MKSQIHKFRPDKLNKIIGALICVILAFLVGSLLILAIGGNPILAFEKMLLGAFGNAMQLSATFNKMSVLVLSGLSCAAAYRCGLINLGAEGQIYMGALCACLPGLFLNGWPAWMILPLCMLTGMIGGALWGALAGWFKVSFGASEVITTVMLNYIAILLVNYLTNGPLKDPSGEAAKTPMLDESYWLGNLIPSMRLHLGILLAVLLVFGYWLFYTRTKPGFSMRVTGLNLQAALHAGINIKRNQMAAMLISGALAGLAGTVELLGTQHQLIAGFSGGYGFDGIAVALLGGSPAGILGAGLLFSAMKTGGSQMQMFGHVPFAIVSVIQGLIIIFVLLDIARRIGKRWRHVRGEAHL